jgi:hypothetical protein
VSTLQKGWSHDPSVLEDRNFTGEDKSVNNAEHNGYNVDTAWYSDTGATNHITSELDKLAREV